MDQNFLLAIKIFNENSINYWACHGTLLGLIRDKNLIEWDNDIDFGVWHGEIDKNRLINLFLNEGFKLMSDGEGYDFITFTKNNYKRVDINFYHTDFENDLAYSEWFMSKETRIKFLMRSVVENLGYRGRLKIIYLILLIFKPLIKLFYKNFDNKNLKYSAGYTTPKKLLLDFDYINLNNIDIRIPSRFEEILVFLYGKHWKIPVKNFNWIKESPATKISNDRF